MKNTLLREELESFNALSEELITDISAVSDQMEKSGAVQAVIREKILSLLKELEWRAIQLDTVFEDTKSLYERYPTAGAA